jgi:D-glucosaminate-6-phosphate ammonia-lyase
VKSLKDRGAIFARLGVKPIIHAMGTTTRYGGTLMHPEVVQSMMEASQCLVNLDELNRKAGEVVARATGAEAGMVCAGSTAGLLLQAAACMTGADPAKILRLPDTAGMKNEIIIHRVHRFHYDQAYRAAGATLVEVGTPKATEAWMLEEAINQRTAAIAYIIGPWFANEGTLMYGAYPALPLPQVVEIGRRHGVPVIVDAASTLPPADNLQKFTRQGADMVIYSGGKGLRGPQSTGVLCGKQHLIQAALANASPNFAIGRAAKVCKEEIIGLLTALELYLQRDHETDMDRWRAQAQLIVDVVTEVPDIRAVVEQHDVNRPVPEATVYFEKDWKGPSGREIVAALRQGDPPIYIGQGGYADELWVNPHNFVEGDAKLVAERLRSALLRQG